MFLHLHGVKIAEAIGRGLKVPVVSKSPEEAGKHFGWLGFFVGADVPVSSALTQELLGWRPTGPGFIADLNAMKYFEHASQKAESRVTGLPVLLAILAP